MLDPANVPEVAASEIVTRYLMFGKWYLANGTIKYEAFMPPVDLELSVTRLCQTTDAEIWDVGARVAEESRRKLHGRTDVAVKAFADQQLRVECDPLPNNANHALARGWSADKAQQMIVAKQLAATPGLRRTPPPESTR